MRSDSPIQFSIVVPFFNEQENIPPLYMKLTEVMDGIGEHYELVFVDDGSKDNTFKVLSDIYEHDRRVNIVRLRRNFGQTAALKAGFDFARGEVIISMDGDLQHDPDEIPRFVEKIEEGYDLVSGWRHQRKNGRSNYGIGRTIRVFLDLMIVKFLLDYSTRPLQFFGFLGICGASAGMAIAAYLGIDKLLHHTDAISEHGPLMLLAVVLFLSGVQLLSLGLLGEITSRTYYESQNKSIYALREVKSHRKETGDSAESSRASGSSER